MIYETPEEFLHDIANNKLPVGSVPLDQYLMANAWVMVDQGQPVLKRQLMVNGNVYDLKFHVSAVTFSEKVASIVGERH